MSSYFDHVANKYDETRHIPERSFQKIIDFIIDITALDIHHSKILDIGVGTGRTALPLVEMGYEYTGVDISKNMLSQFLIKLGGHIPKNLTLLHQDLLDIHFLDKSFSHIFSYHVLYFIEEKSLLIEKIKRLLKDGGTYIHCDEILLNNFYIDDLTKQWYMLASQGNRKLEEMLAESDGTISDKEDVVYKLKSTLEQLHFKTEIIKGPKWIQKMSKSDLISYFENRRDIYTGHLTEAERERIFMEWKTIVDKKWGSTPEKFIRKQLYVLKFVKEGEHTC
ncbi:class I SAM-dependent methyltransferase [Chengkuizengella marina]|uniref:class I SAM-dependent methyltransferase n=1 Tax=Chengkuizengella marina TaxID=2507566 RepID=UPI001370DF79|nr:class I SAM-dependent methyltransferase [Chengkuizengella marina]